MKWARTVHHVESLAQSCAEMADRPTSLFPLRVCELWAVGEVLGPPADLDWVSVALCVDLPAAEVPWLSDPHGAQHWANATRLTKSPVVAWWRSVHAPVWNHRIVRPALVWDSSDGVRDQALAALRDGHIDELRMAAVSDDELALRLREELAISESSLRSRTTAYDQRRWAPGKLEPHADALWRASNGYLDVLDAVNRT